jgi:hypothetical protein
MKQLKHNQRAPFMTPDQSKPTKPLPPDPEMRNANRARFAALALEAFQRQTGADLKDAVSDLLTDLMHWCDRFGQEFPAELRRACNNYAAETAASPATAAPLSDKL